MKELNELVTEIGEVYNQYIENDADLVDLAEELIIIYNIDDKMTKAMLRKIGYGLRLTVLIGDLLIKQEVSSQEGIQKGIQGDIYLLALVISGDVDRLDKFMEPNK